MTRSCRVEYRVPRPKLTRFTPDHSSHAPRNNVNKALVIVRVRRGGEARQCAHLDKHCPITPKKLANHQRNRKHVTLELTHLDLRRLRCEREV